MLELSTEAVFAAALLCAHRTPDVPVKVSAAAARAEVKMSAGQRLKSLLKKKKKERKRKSAAATELIRGESFIGVFMFGAFLPLRI